jgi:hypothetical protein
MASVGWVTAGDEYCGVAAAASSIVSGVAVQSLGIGLVRPGDAAPHVYGCAVSARVEIAATQVPFAGLNPEFHLGAGWRSRLWLRP